MSDEFVKWDDLDLDYFFGDNNWTDDEEGRIWGHESEWGSDSDNHDDAPMDVMPAAAEKENQQPDKRARTEEKTQSNYTCPICSKQYKSTSGFRGHVLKKHDRPDLKAHQHRGGSTKATDQDTTPPARIPMSNQAELEKEMPAIIDAALCDIRNDKIHGMGFSKYGASMIRIAQRLIIVNMACLCTILVNYMVPIAASLSVDFSTQMRSDTNFKEEFMDFVMTNMDFELDLRCATLFIQRFITCFVTEFFKRRNNMMDKNATDDNETVTDNDKEVLYYICGYMINAMQKRYLKSKSKGAEMINLLENLKTDKADNHSASNWTEILNRGGLKPPTEKFFVSIVQVERWVREFLKIGNLNSDSLVNLKENLMHYNLLRVTWEKLVPGSNANKWLLLDHVLGLFFKVRGFAVTRYIRKQLELQRKTSKIAAGTRKALRKELKQLSSNK